MIVINRPLGDMAGGNGGGYSANDSCRSATQIRFKKESDRCPERTGFAIVRVGGGLGALADRSGGLSPRPALEQDWQPIRQVEVPYRFQKMDLSPF